MDRGQSSVIGTILLVAVVVVLGATVGTYVVSVGGNTQQEYSPIAAELDQTGEASQSERQTNVTLTFTQVSETVAVEDVVLLVDGKPVSTVSGLSRVNDAEESTINTGDRVVLTQTDREALYEGVEITARLEDDSEDKSHLLTEHTLYGNSVDLNGFGFTYSTVPRYESGSDSLCVNYNGDGFDASKLRLQAYDGSQWVPAKQYFSSSFNIETLEQNGKTKINEPSPSGEELRVVYDGVYTTIIVYQSTVSRYSGNC